ncbi:MAG: DUF6362 family protein [Acetobacter sp.]|uniref:DUF6362 family protein n=1 Tax=Acetobacter sp. TaxID=440 RepID=UPI003F938A5B
MSVKRKSTQIDFAQNVPQQVTEWLEEAAFTLAALPANGLRPAGARSGWPDIVRDLEDVGRLDSDIMPPRPEPDEVSRLDQVLSWVQVFGPSEQHYRRVINMRLIVHPISGMHRWNWRKIAKVMGTDHKRAHDWHRCAVEVIAKKIAHPAFFSSQTPQNTVF